MMKVGIDIVQISRFEKKFKENKKYFEEKLFLPEELADTRPEHLAGIFAAKEAVVKALGIGAARWREIEILSQESGKPFVSKVPAQCKDLKSELSISHDGDYAIAFVIFYEF